MNWTNFCQPTVRLKQNIFEQTLIEVGSLDLLYASFATFLSKLVNYSSHSEPLKNSWTSIDRWFRRKMSPISTSYECSKAHWTAPLRKKTTVEKNTVKNVIFGLSGKQLRLSGLKTTKVMQGRIKNTVKWKITTKVMPEWKKTMVEWIKTTVEWIKNYDRVDKKLWLSELKATAFLSNTQKYFQWNWSDT